MTQNAFQWPEGKQVALSLSFDDARGSQADVGLPLFDALGVRATFYVIPSSVKQRLELWRQAVASGHEIGNHTVTHPCSANFTFARKNGLEEYSLEQIDKEIASANDFIRGELGVTSTTFAYPCGQKFVGRGEGVSSYVPVVARHFLAGRGFPDEMHNSPAFCDLAQIYGCNLDGLTFEDVARQLEFARNEGGWLVYAGHEIDTQPGRQTTLTDTIKTLSEYAQDPANGVWLDTVGNIAAYVKACRG